MDAKKDIEGKRFGRLIVIELVPDGNVFATAVIL